MKFTRDNYRKVIEYISKSKYDSQLEFELKYHPLQKHHRLHKSQFERIISYFRNDDKYTTIPVSNTFDIIGSYLNSTYRHTYDSNNRLLKSLQIKNDHDIIDIPDYRMRFKMKRELPVQDELYRVEMYNKFHREKVRHTFHHSPLIYDFTEVTQWYDGGRKEQKFEIEIEYDPTSTHDIDAVARLLIEEYSVILKLLDDTDETLSISEYTSVIDTYKSFFKKQHVFMPKPVTLDRPSLWNIVHGPFEYSVTDKADGERYLCICPGTDRLYGMNDRFDVKPIPDIRVTSPITMILDGEFIRKPDKTLYAAFDAYVIDGTDIRHHNLKDRLHRIPNIIGDNFTVKEFYYFSNLSTLVNACRSSWTIDKPYHIDGLIFTPVDDPVPETNTWDKVFKWKPPDENTIDFQVKLDYIESRESLKFSKDNTSICRKATLFSVETPWIANGHITTLSLLSTNIKPPKHSDPPVLVEFPPSPTTYLQCGKLNGKMVPTCQDGDEIQDDYIVEFAYHIDQWIPKRIRYDKIERQRRTHALTANRLHPTAMSVWNSIQYPITIDHLTKISKFNHDINTDSSSYYVQKNSKSIYMDMRKHHNMIKYTLLERAINHIQILSANNIRLFDFGVGRAGDLNKWISLHIHDVMGIDKSIDNLYSPDPKISGANYRILTNPNPINAIFLPMDASVDLYDHSYLSDDDRKVASHVFGINKIPNTQFFSFASSLFHITSCMFAIHYMFESQQKLDIFCKNVHNVLLPSGVFIGCCLDGETIHNLADDVTTGKGWSIQKKYTLKQFKEGIGAPIYVYMESIGQTLPEYLVKWDVLVTNMKKYDLHLQRTGFFDDFKGLKGDQARYSHMNRWFIFQKHIGVSM